MKLPKNLECLRFSRLLKNAPKPESQAQAKLQTGNTDRNGLYAKTASRLFFSSPSGGQGVNAMVKMGPEPGKQVTGMDAQAWRQAKRGELR